MSPITRRMQASDLPAALKLTQAQNWSHRLEHWELHFRLGRGWVVCDSDGTPMGTALWWAYGANFGSIGLVVVDPPHQGKGIGRRLMNAVLEDAGPRTLQLVATNAGRKLYQQCGFSELGGIAQHQGVLTSLTAVAAPDGTSLRAATRDDLPLMSDLDETACGGNRRPVIDAIFALSTGVVAERDGRVTGFALLRPSGYAAVVGPVIASDETLAMSLISHLLKTHVGAVRVDIPTTCTRLAAWLENANLKSVDRVTQMMRGDPPQRPSDAWVFGLVSQALG